jgi:metallo-beta-lactamase class B
MKRRTGALLLTLFVMATLVAPNAFAQESPRPAGLGENNAQPLGPFKMFDNLYYVGLDFVCAYVIQTSDGLILIDTLFERFWDTPAKGMQALGLNPRDVKYIIITHGHDDHYAGLKKFKSTYAPNARVMMAEADWALMESTLQRQGAEAQAAKGVPRDMVVKDGDELKLGNTTVKMYVTPGHTEGSLSLVYDVTEGGRTYKVFNWAGPTLQSMELPMMEKFLATVKRLQTLTQGSQVWLHSHPWSVSFVQKYEKMKARRPGEANPYVNPGEIPVFLSGRLADTEKRIAEARNRPAGAPQRGNRGGGN